MRFRKSTSIAVFALACATSGRAQQYSFQYYGTDQGLTDLAVRSIYQDATGFLWVSTENGIFRYDGEVFQSFGQAEGLPASNAAMFGEAPDGSLLAGGRFGLYRKGVNSSRFERVPMSGPTTPDATIVNWGAGIQSDGHGTTYIATDAGLMTMTAASGVQPMANPPHSGPRSAFGVLAENGSVWWGCGDELCLLAGGQTTVFGSANGVRSGAWRGIRRAGNGDLWIQNVAGDMAVMRAGSSVFEKAALPIQSGFGPRGLITIDSAGRVIIPLDDGLLVEDQASWQKVGRSAGLRGPVYAVMQDREGSVWLGLAGHGLAKWRGYGQWEHFNSDSGLGSDLAYEVAPAANGAFWAGTDAGLFLGQKTPVGWTWKRQPQLGDLPIHSVRPDGQGRLWLGTEGRGAARLDTASGAVEWFGAKQGLTALSPYTMLHDTQNRIWAATLTGLFVADARTLKFRPVDGIPGSAFCVAIVEAKNGDIWAGTRAGLFYLSHGQWHEFRSADLSNHSVLSLAADPNGDVWVGYQFGDQIDRIHADESGWTVTREKGEAGDTKGTTYFLGFDARGRLWAGTNRGVDVFGAEWEHYDHHDGLVWDDCDLNGFHANPDGTIWIGTSGGLALFTPRSSPLIKPPSAILTQLTLGKKSVDEVRSVSVDHTANSLTARFSALTFVRENAILFRYRLLPLSSDWRETSERELEFPGLPANSYRLEIQARDGWGRWSSEPATFSFEVRPAVWRAWWFVTVCAIAPFGLVGIAFRVRGRTMRRKEEELRRLVDDRTRELKQATSQLQEANRNLLELSAQDGLTGIANRRILDLTLEDEWVRARRAGTPLSVVIADVDFFKRLNDRLGHQTGDQCLRLVASALASTGRRGMDCIARYGGEEFALLLPGVDKAGALLVAERARQAVADLEFPHPDSSVGPVVTVSLGVATACGNEFSGSQELVAAADSALFEAKRQGRNRVVSGSLGYRSLSVAVL